jgi:hypothetical protein
LKEASFLSKEKIKLVVSLNMDMIQIKGEKNVFNTITDITEIKKSEKIQELLRIWLPNLLLSVRQVV